MALLVLYALFVASISFPWCRSAEVYVNPSTGNDTTCSSLQLANNDSNQVPCKTINRALGNVVCSRNCSNSEPLYNSTVKLSDGVHTLHDCIAILQGENITILAENKGMATVRCGRFPNTEVQDNIISCETRGLVIRGVHFEGCGPLSPNVFINGSTDVLFEDCTFRGNTGSPLQLQFVPTITLLRTNFMLNQNDYPSPQDAEDITTSALFSSITTAGGFTYFNLNSTMSITIEQCKFIRNRANTNSPSDTRPLLLKVNGHGGAVVIRLSGITNGSISIANSLFDGNEAEVNGGGIYFSLSNLFASNSIYLYNNTFVNNRVLLSSGGALSWIIFSSSVSYNNLWRVEDCNFINNSGSAGGAVSISLHGNHGFEESFFLPDRVEFTQCIFDSNEAVIEGTAVGLFALVHVEEFGFPVQFTDCDFRKNHYFLENSNTLNKTESLHSSALLAFRFPVELKGRNSFVGNLGGGITLLNARLSVTGELLLLSNVAMFGGGIAMDDSCLIEVSPGVQIDFINNIANFSGGGIHANIPAIRHTTSLFNRFCFLQYIDPSGVDTPLYEWNASISFVRNQARQSGAAIFASDMLLCSWIGNNFTQGNIFQESSPGSPFSYRDNILLGSTSQINTNLATAPHRIHVIPMLLSAYVQPGERVYLNILCRDQLLNNREAVWLLEAPQEENLDGVSDNNETFAYTIPETRLLIENLHVCSDNSNGSFRLYFSLPNTLGRPTNISLELNGCHPGYNMDLESCLCQCNSGDHRDILRCDENNRYIYLRSGVWGGMMNSNGSRNLITANVPAYYLSCDREGRLSGCLFRWDNSSSQCRTGRHGLLCGVCDVGYGITLDLQACEKNDNCILGLSLLIIFFVLVVVFSLLVLFFDIGLPNELKGLFFYTQVIGLVYRPYFVLESTSDADPINPLTILTNMLGFSIPIPLCISTSLQAQHIALLGYIPPILMLATVTGYVVSVRFVKMLSNRSSLNGITLLSLLIYKYIADTSFTLISCTSTSIGWVFTYNGSIMCSSPEMIFLVVVGIILVSFFVGPVPFGVAYICVKRPIKLQHYADVLTKELCTAHRWFGGWDIGRRLLFIFFGFISVRPSLILLLMTFSALWVLLVHLLVQPYEKRYINIAEGLVLINLVFVCIVFLNPSASQLPIWCGTVLLLLPYIYGLLYFTWILVYYMYQKYLAKHQDKKNIFTKGRQITLGKKTLMISGIGHSMTVKLSKQSTQEDTNTVQSGNTSQEEKYTEEQFCELRESMLDL